MKAFYENRNYNDDISVFATVTQNMNFAAHWHLDIEMLYVLEGSIGVGINQDYKILKKGEIAICGSNDIHYYNSEGMTSSVIMIIFRPDIFKPYNFLPDNMNPSSVFLDEDYFNDEGIISDDKSFINNIFVNIIKETKNKKELFAYLIKLRISELFILLFRFFPSYYNNLKITISSNITPMQKALKYLEDNYNKEITLDIISNHVNLSSFYFSRLFKKTTGTNFSTYLTKIRVDKAEQMIKSTDKHIIEIAYETGFNSIRTFNRSFKNIREYTPQSLRK